MYIDEETVGRFRVYGAAIEAAGGFEAAVSIRRLSQCSEPIEVFRNERLSDPHLWDDPEQALRFAMRVGLQVAEEWTMAAEAVFA